MKTLVLLRVYIARRMTSIPHGSMGRIGRHPLGRIHPRVRRVAILFRLVQRKAQPRIGAMVCFAR